MKNWLAKHRNKLVSRLVYTFVPLALLPLLIFGFQSISSHFNSVLEQNVEAQATMANVLAAQLESQINDAIELTSNLAKNLATIPSHDKYLRHNSLNNVRMINQQVENAVVVDLEGRVQVMSPYNASTDGKKIDLPELDYTRKENVFISIFNELDQQDNNSPYFFISASILNDEGKYSDILIVRFAIRQWYANARSVVNSSEGTVGALVAMGKKKDSFIIEDRKGGKSWHILAAIKSASHKHEMATESGEIYRLSHAQVPSINARFVLARPRSLILAEPRSVLYAYVINISLLALALTGLIVFTARSITAPVGRLARLAAEFSGGNLDARIEVSGAEEIRQLAQSLNDMGLSIKTSQQKTKILYKSIHELFACNDLDGLFRKVTELACTQCQGDVAWFVPPATGHNREGGRPVFDVESLVLHGWVWKNHRSTEISHREANSIWPREDGDRVFSFVMKGQRGELGVIKVAYRTSPEDFVISLLHSLIALLETAIQKLDLIREGAVISTELELAESVQRSIMSMSASSTMKSEVSYHYQPASRLGGDWFYMIENAETRQLYVLMGDVTGHGLAQGLVTTAVKGALDVLDCLLRSGSGKVFDIQPDGVVRLLAQVIERVTRKSELAMTCLVALVDFNKLELRVCNAGHTFPVLLRRHGDAVKAEYLHLNQQSMLGMEQIDHGDALKFESTTYPLTPGDKLVLYTDGLSEARNLNSKVFGRFMLRSLQSSSPMSSPAQLRDEILEMFRYYTQGKESQDDVCFVVVGLPEAASGRKSA